MDVEETIMGKWNILFMRFIMEDRDEKRQGIELVLIQSES